MAGLCGCRGINRSSCFEEEGGSSVKVDLLLGDLNERNLKRNEEKKLRDNILVEES